MEEKRKYNGRPYPGTGIDTLISEKSRFLIMEAEKRGSRDGLGRLHLDGTAGLSACTGWLRSAFEALMSEAEGMLLPELEKDLGTAEYGASEEKSNAKDREEHELRMLLPAAEAAAGKQLPWAQVVLCIGGVILSLLMVLGDWAYLSASLQCVMPSYAGSMLLGLCLSAALAAVGHLCTAFLSRIQSTAMRRAAALAVAAGVAAVFAWLGMLRQEYARTLEGRETGLWGFVLVNLLIFFALLLVSRHVVLPGLPYFAAFVRIRAARDRHARISSRLRLIRKEKEEIKESVRSYYRQAVESYKAAYIRASGKVPAGFGEEIMPLRYGHGGTESNFSKYL